MASVTIWKPKESVAVYARMEASDAETIRTELAKHKSIQVTADYETFYGCGFESWLRKILRNMGEDTVVSIDIIDYHPFENYPYKFKVELHNKSKFYTHA